MTFPSKANFYGAKFIYNEDSIAQQTKKEMKGGGEFSKKRTCSKYKEMKGEIDF